MHQLVEVVNAKLGQVIDGMLNSPVNPTSSLRVKLIITILTAVYTRQQQRKANQVPDMDRRSAKPRCGIREQPQAHTR